MFGNLIQSSFLAIALSSILASAAGSLNVKVDGPNAVNDVKDLKFTAKIINTGREAMTLVNDPSGLLSSEYPTEKYDVVHTSGTGPTFKGIRVKFSPKNAVDRDDVITLAPGQSVSVEHDLSQTYDFTTPGEGSYSFEPKNVFYAVDMSTKKINVIQADKVSKLTVNLSGNLGIPEPPRSLHKRNIGYFNCTAREQIQITKAAQDAVKYMNKSRDYLAGVSSGTPRYTTWFGEYADDKKNLVQSHFDRSINSPLNVTYNCSCTSGLYAYVFANDPSTIYLCGEFWYAPLTGSDSQAGTIVHESTHFNINGGTTDFRYGKDACTQLARDEPFRAILNADSHQYFAENDPFMR